MIKLLILIYLLFPLVIYSRNLNVVCSTADIGDIAKNITGNKADVVWLSDGRFDPHLVEPKPSMVMKVRNADLVIVVGMDLDMWMNGIISASKNSKVQKNTSGYLDLSEKIEKAEVPSGKIDGSHGDVHIYGNPHYHLNPENGIVMAEEIKERIITLDTENKTYYEKNFFKYKGILENKIREWKEKMKPFKEIHVLPTHNCWLYFINAFEINSVGFLEKKPGIPPSPNDILEISEIMKKNKTKIIIAEPFYPGGSIEKIKQLTGAKDIRIPSSVFGVTETDSYINLFEYNISKLLEAIKN